MKEMVGREKGMDEGWLIGWLLEGDPAIRWQALRDIADADAETWARERRKIATEGWGARLLAHQDADGRWDGQLYNHKWLSTTYSLLLLRQMGLEPGHPPAHLACQTLLEGGFQAQGGIRYAKSVGRSDNGVTGMILSLLAYFGYPDGRVHAIAEHLLGQQMSDGRWEPFAGNAHLLYTFCGTLLVLDGLREYEKRYPQEAGGAAEAQRRGREFLLRHKLFKVGQPEMELNKQMLRFAFPPRWHYDVLAALDYFQDCRPARDARLSEAIDLLHARRNPDGSWNLSLRHAGKTFFEMEQVGRPSRWNTLRTWRVLRWWEGAGLSASLGHAP